MSLKKIMGATQALALYAPACPFAGIMPLSCATAVSSQPSFLAIGRALGRFFAHKARDLPWRRTQDPYAIWVSEIMLQQTQVDTVIPYYHKFLARFPTVDALAHARVEQVCEAWSGLGYYRRARFLHQAAKQLVAQHDSQLPASVEALQSLPGIGRYTAGAIASLAFGQRVPLVDGNVARVLSRLLLLPHHLGTPAGVKSLWAAATALVEARGPRRPPPGVLNEALIELGATVCVPRRPVCDQCPVSAFCRAHAVDMVHAYPPVAPRAAPQAMHVVFIICRTEEGLWLSQRGIDGLWAGQWEPPSASGPSAVTDLDARGLTPLEKLATVSHQLTHRRITAEVFGGRASSRRLRREGLVPWSQPLEAPLSKLARKALIASSTTSSL